jgi:hypothetical protein
MMRPLTFLIGAVLAFGADNPWEKVKELKSGSELRIWKKGVSTPIEAVYDDLGEEKLLVVVKNEQVAIPRDGIDRIDARASAKTRKPKVESTVTRDINRPERVAAPPRSQRESPPGAPSSSATSSVSWSNPGFETVYRRRPIAAKQ